MNSESEDEHKKTEKHDGEGGDTEQPAESDKDAEMKQQSTKNAPHKCEETALKATQSTSAEASLANNREVTATSTPPTESRQDPLADAIWKCLALMNQQKPTASTQSTDDSEAVQDVLSSLESIVSNVSHQPPKRKRQASKSVSASAAAENTGDIDLNLPSQQQTSQQSTAPQQQLLPSIASLSLPGISSGTTSNGTSPHKQGSAWAVMINQGSKPCNVFLHASTFHIGSYKKQRAVASASGESTKALDKTLCRISAQPGGDAAIEVISLSAHVSINGVPIRRKNYKIPLKTGDEIHISTSVIQNFVHFVFLLMRDLDEDTRKALLSQRSAQSQQSNTALSEARQLASSASSTSNSTITVDPNGSPLVLGNDKLPSIQSTNDGSLTSTSKSSRSRDSKSDSSASAIGARSTPSLLTTTASGATVATDNSSVLNVVAEALRDPDVESLTVVLNGNDHAVAAKKDAPVNVKRKAKPSKSAATNAVASTSSTTKRKKLSATASPSTSSQLPKSTIADFLKVLKQFVEDKSTEGKSQAVADISDSEDTEGSVDDFEEVRPSKRVRFRSSTAENDDRESESLRSVQAKATPVLTPPTATIHINRSSTNKSTTTAPALVSTQTSSTTTSSSTSNSAQQRAAALLKELIATARNSNFNKATDPQTQPQANSTTPELLDMDIDLDAPQSHTNLPTNTSTSLVRCVYGELVEKVTRWQDIQTDLNSIPWLRETTKQQLIDAAYIYLKAPNLASKFLDTMALASRKILLSGPTGTELYQQRLAAALAAHFKVNLINVELQPYMGDSTVNSDRSTADQYGYSMLDPDAYVPSALFALQSEMLSASAVPRSRVSSASRTRKFNKGDRVIYTGSIAALSNTSSTSTTTSSSTSSTSSSTTPFFRTLANYSKGILSSLDSNVQHRGTVTMTFENNASLVGIRFDNSVSGNALLSVDGRTHFVRTADLKAESEELTEILESKFLEALSQTIEQHAPCVVYFSDIDQLLTSYMNGSVSRQSQPTVDQVIGKLQREVFDKVSASTPAVFIGSLAIDKHFERVASYSSGTRSASQFPGAGGSGGGGGGIYILNGSNAASTSNSKRYKSSSSVLGKAPLGGEDHPGPMSIWEHLVLDNTSRSEDRIASRKAKYIAKLFTNHIFISPPDDTVQLTAWNDLIQKDTENIRASANAKQLHKILSDCNVVLAEEPNEERPELVSETATASSSSDVNAVEKLDIFKEAIIPPEVMEKVVGMAISHYLRTASTEAVTSVEKLALPLSSVVYAFDVQKSILEAAKLAAQRSSNTVPGMNVLLNANIENEFEKRLLSEVIPPHEIGIKFDDIGALDKVKDTLKEMVMLPLQRPELFKRGNLTKPCKGILLFGPPGTGKTMLARAVATESGANFLNIQMSTISSKWFGEAEKYVRAVFSLASKIAPAVIFIDEVDSILGKRDKSNEHEAMRKVKNEFMMLWDGLRTRDLERVLVLGATNRPFEIDDAVLRRMPRRLLVDLPDAENRAKILKVILANEELSDDVDLVQLAQALDGYTGSDMKHLCVAAAHRPIREFLEMERKLKEQISKSKTSTPADEAFTTPSSDDKPNAKGKGKSSQLSDTESPEVALAALRLRPLRMDDFIKAKEEISSSVSENSFAIAELRKWNEMYGEGGSRNQPTLTYFA